MTAIDYDGLVERLRELDTHLEGEFWTIGNAVAAIQTLRAELADRDARLEEAVEWERNARELLLQAANYMPRIMHFLNKQGQWK